MKKLTFLILMGMIVASCATKKEETNPFFMEYQTPFGVPPFSEIKLEHFKPAFEEGIKQQDAIIAQITSNTEEPTFENTIEALEYSGELIGKVSGVFYNYLSSNISDSLQALAQEIAPMMSAHGDNISLNMELFNKVKAINDKKDELNLDPEQKMLLKVTYENFMRNGAAIPAEQQERFREINQQLSVLTLKFSENVLNDVNTWKMFIENEADLAGLPQSLIDGAAEAAKNDGKEGQWLFTLQNPSVMPFLSYAENRDLRQKMNEAYINRGNMGNENDNKQIINDILRLRIERAQMLGFDTFANYILDNRMAKTTETVTSFLNQLWEAALPIAQEEAAIMQEQIKNDGNNFELAYWDWRYYAEKVRKEKYNVDESEISQYFELSKVRDGIFMVVEKLYGLKFAQRNDVPVYHPDATAWEVTEADGTHVGMLYMDMHPRASKRPGAWMSNYRGQYIDKDGKYVHPVVTLVCNFTAPSGNQPALLTFDEMRTFFHEFGHGLHGLMADTHYPSISGTSTPTDFVELPSQIMENWARHPEVMKMFAKHWETGDTIPDELITKIQESSNFNEGFATVEFLSSALLDMEYHTKTAFEPIDIQAFEDQVQAKFNMMDEIYFRHGSTHFQHIFSSDFYAAGYYSYIWSGVLDADAFEAFVETGDLFDQETARKFREEVLSKGGTREAMDMYVAFRGKEPGIEPLLRQRGLVK